MYNEEAHSDSHRLYDHMIFISMRLSMTVKHVYQSFFRIGLTIARFPIITIIISITIPALLSIGMLKFELDEDFADLLLPPTSRIFPERDWVEEHVPYEQRPVRLILKNDNVLSKESLIAVR